MPTYAFRCSECDEVFEQQLTFAEFDRREVACPKCESARVEPLLAAVGVKTSKKS